MKFKPGAAIVTNDEFSSLFIIKGGKNVDPWHGELVAEHESIKGAWWVRVTSPDLRAPQVINERYMEAVNV